jgi:5-methylcytosine-specific restriction endonuclease McrA
MKRCCRCKETKSFAEFKRNKSAPDGYCRECKACCKVRYIANRAQILAYRREYYETHREESISYTKRYRLTEKGQERERRLNEARAGRLPENPTPGELRARDWYLAYREAHAENYRENGQRWREEHRQHSNAYHRAYQARERVNHPERHIAHRHQRKARKLGNGGTFTAMQWRLLKARYNYTCLRCGKREPEIKLSPDHVVPLSRGGANSIDNIQPLCAACNYRKHAKHVDYRPAV